MKTSIFAPKENKLDSLFEGLNKEQQIAVKKTEGPVMVIAGAGSGKTRVLTFRIAYLLELGVDPFNILALTFTNKAAKEMKNRIGDIVGFQSARNVWMGTFHSVFARILRSESDKLGFPTNFTIYDTDDSKNLIKMIVKEGTLDPKIYQASRVDKMIQVDQESAEQTMRDLASKEGIFAGVSSGGAVAAALRLAQQVENATIVTIVCDRGDRYLSTGVYPG